MLLALAAACAAPAPRTVTPTAASAAFVSGNVIAITVIDPQPLAAAALIAGDGTSYAAGEITTSVVAPADGGLQPQFGLAGSGGPRSGSDIGVGVMLPMFSWGGAKGILQSRATVTVPDMAAYRATWRLWQIRARLGRPGAAGAGYVSIPAPAPPG
ncbi:MAG TPA: hypothetical protein VMU42_14955 [Candidatus Sulfotelmatobacter sp.]|nr:hypothetical protein [Candidatus Sulfotelmatobacter sp.]